MIAKREIITLGFVLGPILGCGPNVPAKQGVVPGAPAAAPAPTRAGDVSPKREASNGSTGASTANGGAGSMEESTTLPESGKAIDSARSAEKDDSLAHAAQQLKHELTESAPRSIFNIDIRKTAKYEPDEVIFDAVFECTLRWKRTTVGFRPLYPDGLGEEIKLQTTDGKEATLAALDGGSLEDFRLDDHFVRRSSESGEVLYEGNERLLDFLGWPSEMLIAAHGDDADRLWIRSSPYRITMRKREGTEDQDKPLIDGMGWEVVSVEHSPTE